MNKSALKNFATKARTELLERVELEARKIGITKEKVEKATVETSDAVFINDRQLSDIERKQRNKLIARIDEIGFDRVMEEAAYTWFNRFVALRFMEVNDYLPTRIRVLSSENEGSTEPDMITEALSLDLDIDRDLVYNLKLKNKTDELFKYLIKLHCNDLNRYMPFMFETIEDYNDILFPEGLLGTDSFVREMTDTDVIPEDNWKQIEIIGWLYQFYIAEEKDRVFKEGGRYKAEEIPFATQLFTPDWIVQYMVQNSLGRYWVEAHPEHDDLKQNWEFFIEHQQEDFQEKIEPYINKNLNVEEIKCLDPAMGSGHILVYMFDVLYEIYSKSGYMEREIPRLIIENNLYGLDIDDRAYQLACFSVVMKALEYNRRFLRSIERDGLTLNLASIQETNLLNEQDIAYLANEESGDIFEAVKAFIEQFRHAKSIGSLIKVKQSDTKFLLKRLKEIVSTPVEDLLDAESRENVLGLLPQLIKQTEIMCNQYNVVVTNPPYLGSSKMNKDLSNYVRQKYPDSRGDLFAAFMEIDQFLNEKSLYAMITQDVWMYKSSYKKLRKKIVKKKYIDSMIHLGPGAFEEIGGEMVQSTTFILRNIVLTQEKGTYIRALDGANAIDKKILAVQAIENPTVSYRFNFKQKNYSEMPGYPIAYWVSESIWKIFSNNPGLGEIAAPRKGLTTGKNARFVRLWFEVDTDYFSLFNSNAKWFPMTSGGEYRRWYGNNEYVVNWENDGYQIRNFKDKNGRLRSRPQNISFYFKRGISWNDTASAGRIAFRYQSNEYIPSASGPCVYSKQNLIYLFGLLNSKVSNYLLFILSPSIKYEVGQMALVPIVKKTSKVIEKIVKDSVDIARIDWDSFEISWDFKKHPLLRFPSNTIETSFKQWEEFTQSQFGQLKENEEELNRIFIDIYGLQDELTPDVKDEDVTVSKADLERDIKSFISYAVGCMLGRYSLDEDGLIYAGGEFDPDRYKTFQADENNILPILPGAYFEDDIVTRFVQFVEVTYGEETLEENLQFVADAIGRRKNETPREAIRRYFLTPSQFYQDHVRTYKRTPIYWLFTSGRERAFNCLIYMHRYDSTTLSRIRTDYLHDVQTRYESEKQDLQMVIEGDSTAKEIRDARRELTSVERKLDELKEYDEKLGHLADMQIEIDLDDGVRENYKKFEGLLARL